MVSAPRERRESERAVAYWHEHVAKLAEGATTAALDLTNVASEDWSHRFVITLDPVSENSALLLYGADFARLLDLQGARMPYLPLIRRLPRRFYEVFLRGCHDALNHNAPARVEGEVEREDGRRELFRAVFIPVGSHEDMPVRLAFGAFNSCIAPEPAPISEPP